MIKWGTHSNYSHSAVILRDPSFIHPSLKGFYVWESGEEDNPDPQDGKKKIGVQISPIDEVFSPYKRTGGHVYYRKVESQENLFTDEKLKEVHKIVYDKPYDILPGDWVEAFTQKDPNPQKTNRFSCR